MNKIIFISFFLISGFLFSGCQTAKNTAVATGIGTYMVGKGVVADIKSVFGPVNSVDAWFKENYW